MDFKLLLLLLLIIITISYCVKNKVIIHFLSFFKKGFKVKKDKFGCYCFTRQTGLSVRRLAP